MYGSDCSTTAGEFADDLDTTGAEMDDASVIAEDMRRAVTTKAGVLPWAPEDTLDLNDELGKAGSDADRSALERRIEDLFARDERYLSVEAVVTFADARLRVAINAETDIGPFELVLEQQDEAMRVVKS